MFYLQRIADGWYVAPRGEAKSYTKHRVLAREFKTRRAAEKEKCGNERVVAVPTIRSD
jgi:hypothetical protein